MNIKSFIPTIALLGTVIIAFPANAQIVGKDSTYQVNTSTYPDVDMEPWVDPNDNPQVEQSLQQENQQLLNEQQTDLTNQGNAEHSAQQSETGANWNNFSSAQVQQICAKHQALGTSPPAGISCGQ
ncbi:MAG: hypothetical protein GC137_10795 [Alphaproteobacteria bacterium]|nr:hypothetical protein [Alphaproteobacteria bacterium]